MNNLEQIIHEEIKVFLDEKKKKKKKKKAKKKKGDRCTRIAKRKYDVWPSAYASGAVVRCRKGEIWKGLKEDDDDVKDKYGSEVADRSKRSLKKSLALAEEKDDLQAKIRKALRDEGGAAGMNALEKHTKAPATEIRKAIKEMDDVGRHEDGDYILEDGEEVDIVDEDLRKWFGRKGESGSKSGWVDCNTCRKDKKTGRKKCKACGREKGEKRSKYPACRPTPAACGKRGKWGKKSKAQSEALGTADQNIEELVLQEMENMYLEALCEGETIEEAEYRGRKVKLNKPMRGDVKKFKVYVKNAKGNVVKVNFGHGGTSAKKKGEKTMKIRKSNPKARKSFRARHNCDNPGPKWKARYWSCKKW